MSVAPPPPGRLAPIPEMSQFGFEVAESAPWYGLTVAPPVDGVSCARSAPLPNQFGRSAYPIDPLAVHPVPVPMTQLIRPPVPAAVTGGVTPLQLADGEDLAAELERIGGGRVAHRGRQIVDTDLGVAPEEHDPFQHVRELSDVPRPGVAAQNRERLGAEPLDR